MSFFLFSSAECATCRALTGNLQTATATFPRPLKALPDSTIRTRAPRLRSLLSEAVSRRLRFETPVAQVGRAARRNADLDSPVTVLRGVQDATARLLKRLGVYTVRDALLFFPFRYDDFSEMKPIAELEPEVNQTIVATIWEVEARTTRTGRPLITAVLADDSGTISRLLVQPGISAQVAAPGRPYRHLRQAYCLQRSPAIQLARMGALRL